MRESRFQLATGDRNVGTLYLPDERREPLPVLILSLPFRPKVLQIGVAQPTARSVAVLAK